MIFDRTGFILYTINYAACVQFYETLLKLPILFKTDQLTCFAFGEAYLMVELDDTASEETVRTGRIKTCFRMNVENVRILADKLIEAGIDVDY